MSEKWKLVYDEHILKIHNEEGKDLSYNPNSGIQILVVDGYAFKDLNRSGDLDPFEDWRLPLEERVKDFCERYDLSQQQDVIFYHQGVFALPQSMVEEIKVVKDLFAQNEYLQENYLLAVLLLMFDRDSDQNVSDYIIQLFLQSLQMGMLDKVLFTIRNAVKNYLHGKERFEQLAFEL